MHRLRAKAESELGEKFDPRDYYDVVLQCGAVPLDTLEELVDQYIDRTKNGTPVGTGSNDSSSVGSPDASFLESMTFANWCKCCVVPGTCDQKL